MRSSSDYEHLRNWYLAHLRKLSLQYALEFSLTPGALILADRDNIERIILKTKNLNPAAKPSARAIWLESLGILAALLFSGFFHFWLAGKPGI